MPVTLSDRRDRGNRREMRFDLAGCVCSDHVDGVAVSLHLATYSLHVLRQAATTPQVIVGRLFDGNARTAVPCLIEYVPVRVRHQGVVAAPRAVLKVEEVERRLPPTKRIPNNSGGRLLPRCSDDAIGLMHLSQKSDEAQARWSHLAEGSNGHELLVLEHDDNAQARRGPVGTPPSKHPRRSDPRPRTGALHQIVPKGNNRLNPLVIRHNFYPDSRRAGKGRSSLVPHWFTLGQRGLAIRGKPTSEVILPAALT